MILSTIYDSSTSLINLRIWFAVSGEVWPELSLHDAYRNRD